MNRCENTFSSKKILQNEQQQASLKNVATLFLIQSRTFIVFWQNKLESCSVLLDNLTVIKGLKWLNFASIFTVTMKTSIT